MDKTILEEKIRQWIPENRWIRRKLTDFQRWRYDRAFLSAGDVRRAFGDPEKAVGGEWDIGLLARQHKENGVDVPPLFMAVGENDFIRDVVRRDRDALRALGYPLHYEEAPGLAHEWDFWDRYVRKALYEWLPLKRAAVG